MHVLLQICLWLYMYSFVRSKKLVWKFVYFVHAHQEKSLPHKVIFKFMIFLSFHWTKSILVKPILSPFCTRSTNNLKKKKMKKICGCGSGMKIHIIQCFNKFTFILTVVHNQKHDLSKFVAWQFSWDWESLFVLELK